MRQKSKKPPPKSRLGLTGPKSGWRRGFTDISRGWISETTCPGILIWTPFSLVLSSSLSLCPCPWSHSGYPDLLVFFQGHCQLHQASFLWREVEHLQLEAECLQTKGHQQVVFAVARLKAKDLYDILWEVMTQPELSMSVGLPPPKKCRQAPTATVSWPAPQETVAVVLNPSVQKLEGVHQNKGALSYLSPNPKGVRYLLRWHPYVSMYGMPTGSIAARWRGALREPHPPMPPSALMCTTSIWAWSCHVPSAPLPF